MSMTRPVDASIQAVSPESILGSELVEVGGLFGSEAGSDRTTEPVNNITEATSSASSKRFTGNLLRRFHRSISERDDAGGEGSSTNGHTRKQFMRRADSCANQECEPLILQGLRPASLAANGEGRFNPLPTWPALCAWDFSTTPKLD
jgi:hypothetical protein